MERSYRQALRAGVHDEREEPVPGPRACRGAHLIAEGERRRIPMMPVGDQNWLLGQPRSDRRITGDRPPPVDHPLRVKRLGVGWRGGHLVQQIREGWAWSGHGAVDGGELGVRRSKQPQPILDRSLHRAFVGEHAAAPILELHGAQDAANPACRAESHLIRMEGSRDAHERAFVDPSLEEDARLLVPVLGGQRVVVSRCQIDAADVVRPSQVSTSVHLADNVVRRRRDSVKWTNDDGVVDEGFEGEHARHDPCIAATALWRPPLSKTRPSDGTPRGSV